MSKDPYRFREIILKPQNSFFVLSGILVLLISVAIYLLLGKQAKDTLVEQMLHREQLAARAGGNSIETFFELFGKSMTSLANTVEVKEFGKDVEDLLNQYIKSWEGTPVSGVILLDEKGVVKFNGNRNLTPEVGPSLADRAYFINAKEARRGDVIISSPLVSRLGASKGKYVVIVATPVILGNDSFKGTLAAAVIVDELTDQYISPLKISDKTRIYLIDKDGFIISSPIEKLIGINYLDRILNSGIPGSRKVYEILKQNLDSNEEGKIDIALPDETRNNILTRFLVARAPVNVGNEHWVLAVATPASDALAYLTPFYFRHLAIVGFAFLAFLIISIRIAKVVGYKEAVEAEHKEHRIKEHKIRD